MGGARLTCPRCGTAWPVAVVRSGARFPCPACGTPTDAAWFPALLRENTGAGGETAIPGDATCFHHPDRRAEEVCADCGRFICGLCAIETGDRRVCGLCLGSEIERGGRALRFTPSLVQYDSMALAMVALPLLSVIFSFFTVVTAPLAVFLCARHWRRPMSVLPRTRVRLVLALILGAVVTAAWIALAVFLFAAADVRFG